MGGGGGTIIVFVEETCDDIWNMLVHVPPVTHSLQSSCDSSHTICSLSCDHMFPVM